MSARSDAKEKKSDVLYQRLGNRWYAFSVVDGDVFFAEVPADSIKGSVPGETNDLQETSPQGPTRTNQVPKSAAKA